jgi:6-phosphogluconate dehydrogenase
LVQAGAAVDSTIEQLGQFMESGDIIIDGGNEWFPNSVRRAALLEPRGIHFMGMGISGGEEGARNGPSLMPGGPREAYNAVEPILQACAAQVSDGACLTYIGPIGSGNYVKMIHNGRLHGSTIYLGCYFSMSCASMNRYLASLTHSRSVFESCCSV